MQAEPLIQPASEADLRRERRSVFEQALAAGAIPEALARARELLAEGRAADIAFCATAFRKSSALLLAAGHKPLKTFVVRSVTLEPVLPAVHVEAVLHGYLLDVMLGGYGSYMDEMLDPQSSLGRSAADLVLVLLDLEDIAGRLPQLCAAGDSHAIQEELKVSLGRVAQMLSSYRAAHSGRLVLGGCVVPEVTSLGPVGGSNMRHSLAHAVKDLNRHLSELCATVADCVFFDVDGTAAQFGRERWRDQRMFLASRLPLAPGAFRPFARSLLRAASTLFRAPRKVLCTDLDNTLWGGVLGEEGPEGIATGNAFPGNCYLAYQTYLKELSARGILLAIASKNNPEDVAEAFRTRAADLALTLDDFVARKISWGEKADALRALAGELSLGLDAFVFVDDNPVECAAIRQQLPEVAVLEMPVTAPWEFVDALAAEWFFDAATVTADDRNRSVEYKAQAQRELLSQTSANRDEFLQSLEIVCTFLSAADAPLARSVQLLAKTNQFNLTTRRHAAADVLQFAADPTCQAVAVRVRDRFGEAGVVGLALTRQDSDTCVIDSLLLSCRVIGRGIETAILAHLAEGARQLGSRWLIGEYISTKKNVPCKDFYPQHGFTRVETPGTGESELYRLDLSAGLPPSPGWLTLEGQQLHEQLANPALAS